MPNGTNIVYRYDGSYDGLMSCIFECFRAKENPAKIEPEDEAQETLFKVKYIETDLRLSERVKTSIPVKISPEAEKLVMDTFLSCLEDKEIKILSFLRKGYKTGKNITNLSTDDDVYTLQKAVKYLGNEAHLSLEFLRFSEYNDFLAATITPKNNVLPKIAVHFCDRFPDENFVIYDKGRKLAFMHRNDGETNFLYNTEIEFPEEDETEEEYRALWKHFYKTIAIEERKNERLRMNHMPKRYWPNMTEFQEEKVKNSSTFSYAEPKRIE